MSDFFALHAALARRDAPQAQLVPSISCISMGSFRVGSSEVLKSGSEELRR
jgi:hypothetical protein